MMMHCLRIVVLLLASYGSLSAQPHSLQTFTTNNSALQENTIRTLATAPDSALWVGTENGLSTLKNGNWAAIDTFLNLQIRAIAFDSSGYAWVGTFLHGLWVQTDTGWINYLPSNSDLPADHVRTIAFCPNGDAWIGTVGGAVMISNGVWQVYQTTNTNWIGSNIGASYCSPTNEIWLGGVNNGLMHQVDTGWVIYHASSSNLPDNTILDLQGKPNGDIVLAMPTGGIAIFDGNQGWIVYNTLSSFSPSNSINRIAVGNNGKLYFASVDKGLVVFEGGFDWFNISTAERPDTSGTYLPDNDMLTVLQDPNGIIWASIFNQGLMRIEFLDTLSGIASTNLAATALYPNPAQDFIVIETLSPNLTITIIDVLGTEVYNTATNAPKTKVPLGNLPKGTYMVMLQSGGATTAQRLIKY